MNGYFSFLRQVYFFQELSDGEIRDILKYCNEAEFAANQVIFYENEPAERFYIIMSGEVEVWKSYDTPDADILAVHGPGKLFGEMALVEDLPRSATVVSRLDTRLLYIGAQDFINIIKENSKVALSIMKSLSAMIRKSNESFLEDLKRRNLKLEQALTELKSAQKELLSKERFSNMGKFSSMILHDIRNPLSVIKGYAEMIMRSEQISESCLGYMKNILMESERLGALANEMLDYTRGEVRLSMAVVAMPDFMKRLEEYVTRRFASKNISIECSSTVNKPVMFDAERMFRVLQNLSENARKAMSRNGKFSVSVAEEGGSLVFDVVDDGEGMSGEVLEHVFEPFYSSSKAGGTGLGMAIVKSIVDAHDGTIDIHSAPGKGTKIRMAIPFRGMLA